MTGWTTLDTWADTDVPSHSDLNAQMRDNLLHLRETLDWPYGFPACGEPAGRSATVDLWRANACIYERFRGSGTITALGIHVLTSSGNIGVAIYADNAEDGDAAAPAARLATSGAVACPAAGFASVSVASTAITSGQHWAALSVDNLTANFSGSAMNTSGIGPTIVHRGVAGIGEGAHPPPATGNVGFSTAPHISIVGVA